MKKTIGNIFDEASADEIENLVKRNAAPDVSAETLSSVKKKVYAETGIEKPANKSSFVFHWQTYATAAVCLALLFGALFAAPILRGDDTTPINEEQSTSPSGDEPTDTSLPVSNVHMPIVYDATRYPQDLNGSSLEFIIGTSSSANGGENSAPPLFDFDTTGFAVKARVIKNYTDIYYKLDADPDYAPKAYRLIQMECIEVIYGENVPKYFLYLIPNRLFVDMSAYDSLIISMEQLGASNYVLKNDTEKKIESFPIPVFADRQDLPELGNVIAFSNGVFDESLWQNKSWIYGYQFAKHYLDDPQNPGRDLVVKRGSSESDVIGVINTRIAENKQYQCVPSVVSLDFSTQAAKEALEYVKPFENGVFSQTRYGDRLEFRRYINGCQTEETVSIDIATEEVTYSEIRYTNDEMSNIENIAVHLSQKAEEYAEQQPIPPHTDPKGKKLLCLSLYAWYAKADGRLYGVVKTVWRHTEEDNMYLWYYDEEYVLYDMSDSTAKTVSKEELTDVLGPRNIGREAFGIAVEMPMC